MKSYHLPTRQLSVILAILSVVIIGRPTTAASNTPIEIKPIGGAKSSSGVCVIDVTTGEVVAAYRAEEFFTPASTQKLITATTILLDRDPDERLSTRLFALGKISPRGRLDGDLLIQGCGDPSLGSQYTSLPPDTFLQEAVAAIKAAGITSISGRIIADDRAIADNPVVSKWLWEDVGNYYAAGCYGVNYADNRVAIAFRTDAPDSRPVLLDSRPEVDGLRFYNYLSTNRSGIDSAYVYGAPYEYTRRIYGSLPAHKERFVIKSDLPDPPLFLVSLLTDTLRKAGIKIACKPTSTRILSEEGLSLPDDSPSTLLLEHSSAPLAELLRHTLVHSDNMYAEALLRQVGLTNNSHTSLNLSILQLKNKWNEKGFPLDDATLYDGSGLSPLNRITPLMLCRLLAHTARQKESGQLLIDILPRPGEGTLKRFMPDSPWAEKLHLKSGSMTGVQCYAGYYTGKRTYAVVVMVNHFTEPRSVIRREISDTLTHILRSLDNR